MELFSLYEPDAVSLLSQEVLRVFYYNAPNRIICRWSFLGVPGPSEVHFQPVMSVVTVGRNAEFPVVQMNAPHN